MCFTNPHKKNPEESNLENEKSGNGCPVSYPTILVHKRTNTMGEAGWCTI